MADTPEEAAPPPEFTSDTPLPPIKERPSKRDDIFGKGDGPNVDARTKDGINYTAAFVLVAAGHATLQDVARAWKIPYIKLSKRARRENWAGLIRRYGATFQPKLPAPQEADPRKVLEQTKRIEDNRAKTLELAHGLMDKIKATLDEAGKNPLIMDAETIGILARAVKMLGEISMVAVGDPHAIKAALNGPGNTGQPKHPTALITINMPNIVAVPRRIKDVKTIVEDVDRTLQAARDDLNAEGPDGPDEEDLPAEPAPVPEIVQVAEEPAIPAEVIETPET